MKLAAHRSLTLFLAAIALLAAIPLGSAVGAEARPNVLMFAVDDLRPEIDTYGVERMVTPHLDRLAERGVRFDRAYCNIAVCGASRASLMSGLRPTPWRFTSYSTRKDKDAPEAPSLPMTFKQAGYTTISNGKVYHHRTDDRTAWSQEPWRPETSSIWWAKPENRQGPGRGPAYESADEPDSIYPDFQIAQKTIEDLRGLAERDEPFFLACGFYRPHLPFVAPKRYWDLYPPDEVTLPENMYFPRDLDNAFAYSWGEMRKYSGVPAKGPVSDEMARELIRGYHACVSLVDAQVGRVMEELERLGLAENTVVVLWGDHGWQLGEHAMWCKHTNFEVAVRTPLLIAAPGAKTRGTTPRLVEYVDLYPTLCDLAGLDQPGHVQGRSLVPLLADLDAPHKDAVFSRHGGGDSIKTDRYRYTEMRAGRGKGALRGTALFDHQKDPDENQCVVDDPEYADVVAELKAQLDALRTGWNSK